MMDYRYMNGQALAKEVGVAKLPGSNLISYKNGTINAFTKGLVLSVLSKIDLFGGMFERWRLERLFTHVTDYIRVRAGDDGLTVKFRQGNIISLTPKPLAGKNFPDFDFWDPKIEWHQCPNLVEGIAFIEGILAKELKINKKRDLFGIHVDGNYVGWHARYSRSRFRLRSPVPFSMTLKPAGIRRLTTKLKGRRLQRVAYYTIPGMGLGVLFDYGSFRVWNAAQDPGCKNLGPEINKWFNFRIHYLFKLPEDFF